MLIAWAFQVNGHMKHVSYTMFCMSKLAAKKRKALPEGVVNGEDSEPNPNNRDRQKHRSSKRLSNVAPATDAPQKLLQERDVPPEPPVASAEPDLHAALAPPA